MKLKVLLLWGMFLATLLVIILDLTSRSPVDRILFSIVDDRGKAFVFQVVLIFVHLLVYRNIENRLILAEPNYEEELRPLNWIFRVVCYIWIVLQFLQYLVNSFSSY